MSIKTAYHRGVKKMTEWKEVSEAEFYKEIGPQNVHPRIVNNSYPYTSVFVTPNGQEKGKAIGGEAGTVRQYMLPNWENRRRKEKVA